MGKALEIHKGDLVSPSIEFLGHGHVFTVTDVDVEKRRCHIELFKENIKHEKCKLSTEACKVLTWNYLELDLIRTTESMDREWLVKPHKNLNQIKEETAQKFINGESLPDMYGSREIKDVSSFDFSDIYPTVTIGKGVTIEKLETNNQKGEQDMFKILEMYKDNERRKIKEQCNERKKSIIEDDQVQLIVKEMENQIKAIVGEKSEAYCFDYRGLYEDRTERALQELDEETEKKINVLYKKIENIQALLELAPNYEEKIKILRDYEIMDRKKNIIL